ncbi:MAG: DNA-directed RNA polymerase subunit omega [Bacilli bacterium]|jgi:DNA-directed RNA polymerase subunit omega|nr:DNA-directed RNA polymerase subunit omega [Bacilli bacterium]
MIYPSVDKILNTIDSKYILIHAVSQRSKQIIENGYLQKKQNEYVCKKEIGRALEEIEAGLVKVIRK